MSLSDVMGHLRLDVYAEVALVLFLAAFAAMAVGVWRRPKDAIRREACLPLEDDAGSGSPVDGGEA